MQGAHRGAVGEAAERVKECGCSDLNTLLFTPLGAGTVNISVPVLSLPSSDSDRLFRLLLLMTIGLLPPVSKEVAPPSELLCAP